jgi:hypothetical protein
VTLAALATAAGCSAGGQPATNAPATLPRPTCGGARTHLLSADTELLSADKGALTCFGTAARHCKAASLAITQIGVDTGVDYVFTIQAGGTACQVTELSQWYSANFGGLAGKVVGTQCHQADATGAGLLLSCAGQDVLIPSTVTAV